MNNQSKNISPIVISVCGCSGSGKSTFIKVLTEKISCYLGIEALHFNMDDYYKDKEELASLSDEPNFDDPAAIHIDEFVNDLELLKNNHAISRPHYDFKTSRRLSGKYTTLEPSPVIIVDGIFSLCFKLVRDIADYKIFLDVDLKTCLQRRIERDLIYRGRSSLQSELQWHKTVLPMHFKHVQPSINDADLVIDWNEFNKKGLADVLQVIEKKINGYSHSTLSFQYQDSVENGEIH